MGSFRLTLANPPPTSSLWSGRAPDQSMRLTLQSCLERLDRQRDDMIMIYREMLEIRARIAELRTNCELQVPMGDDSALESWDSSVELQPVANHEHLTMLQSELHGPHCQLRLTSPSCQSHCHSTVSFQTWSPDP
ncbi:hypothetical protein BDR04DRAFT_1099950 [Suillus decipiens]|nr:hypothetical protein BDR04DRAFT_1099950 [Suillus decipiens]